MVLLDFLFHLRTDVETSWPPMLAKINSRPAIQSVHQQRLFGPLTLRSGGFFSFK